MLALLVKYIFFLPLWHKIFKGVLNVVGRMVLQNRVTVVNVKVHSNEEIVGFPTQKQSTKGKDHILKKIS